MTLAQTQLARRRLWLGITNVGFWVVAAGAGLGWLTRGHPDAVRPGTVWGLAAGAIGVQSVFDLLGGMTWMPGPRPAVINFLRRWSRGVVIHTLTLAGVGVLGGISLRFTGGFEAGVAAGTLGLAVGRRQLLHALSGRATAERTLDGEKILSLEASDPAFTGGIVGFGRGATSLLPAAWMDALPGPDLAAESSRRRWQVARALPARTLGWILFWNLLGTFLGTRVFHLADHPPAAALFGHGCWMTLWTFASLLVLPALSRNAVFAADRAAADSGHDPRAWITRFPELVGEDGSPNTAVQTIFYPVPSATLRLQQFGRPPSGFVFGNLARSNLFYSWATLTPLGRAVHCNVGRPELWVFPPSA